MSDVNDVIQRHLAAFKAKDADAEPWNTNAEVVAPGAKLRGREQVLDWLRGYWEAFPDAHIEIRPLNCGGTAYRRRGDAHRHAHWHPRNPGG
jgi:hypothetical protein